MSLTWLFCIKFICEKSFSISLDLSSTPWQCFYANILFFNSHERQMKCIRAVCKRIAESTLQSPCDSSNQKKTKAEHKKWDLSDCWHTQAVTRAGRFFSTRFSSSIYSIATTVSASSFVHTVIHPTCWCLLGPAPATTLHFADREMHRRPTLSAHRG